MPEISRWRQRSNEVICRVIAENKGKPSKEIIKAVRQAYPFGERSMHPYKIWLSAVKMAEREIIAREQFEVH